MISSLFILAPISVSIATRSPLELMIGVHFLVISLIVLLLGLLFYIVFRSEERLTLRDGLYIVAMAWITIPSIGAIPLSVALNMPYLDALFEAVSGFTTTGLTMMVDVEVLPRTVLLWRSLMQWVGGVGIVVITLVVLAKPGSPAAVLYVAEGREERLEPSFIRTAKTMFRVYFTMTLIIATLMVISGMPVFDAINHSMTALATGGFTVKNGSIGGYNNVLIEAVSICAMILGAQSFLEHSKMLKGKVREAISSPEFKGFISLLSLFSLGAIGILYWYGYPLHECIRRGLFQATSALSGTGFQTMNIKDAPPPFKIILSIAMLIGGSVFSTTGGIKIFRVLTLTKTVWVHLTSSFKPSKAVSLVKVGGQSIDNTRILKALIIAVLFTLVHIVSTIMILPFIPEDYAFEDAYFETASALGTVGLSVGITGPHLHPVVKIVFIIDMLLGRLEILTLMAVVYGVFRGRS